MEVKDHDKKDELTFTPRFDGDSNDFGELVQKGTVDQSNYFLSLTQCIILSFMFLRKNV